MSLLLLSYSSQSFRIVYTFFSFSNVHCSSFQHSGFLPPVYLIKVAWWKSEHALQPCCFASSFYFAVETISVVCNDIPSRSSTL